MTPSLKELDLRDEIYELDEAAGFIRMSAEWLSRSDIPRSKLGRRILFRRSQLLSYVAAHETHTIGEEDTT